MKVEAAKVAFFALFLHAVAANGFDSAMGRRSAQRGRSDGGQDAIARLSVGRRFNHDDAGGTAATAAARLVVPGSVFSVGGGPDTSANASAAAFAHL